MVLISAFLVTLAGCASLAKADFVLETSRSPVTDAEGVNIESMLGNARDLELVGRVTSPKGESILVTFAQGGYQNCYAVFEGSGYSSGCGSLEPPIGSVVLGISLNGGNIGVVVDTSQAGITAVRVTTGTGETYEVAPLGQLSFITFEDTQSGFELSLIAGDEVIHQEGGR